MEPITFAESNVVFAKDQPEYLPLPAYRCGDEHGTVVFCWLLTWRERFILLLTGRLWQSVLTFGGPLQPQRLQVRRPEFATGIKAALGPPSPPRPLGHRPVG